MFICFVGSEEIPITENELVEYNGFEKIKLVKVSDNLLDYELPTLQFIYEYSKENSDYNVLYLHTKNVGKEINLCIEDQIEYMLYFNAIKWRECINSLIDCDTCGVDLREEPVLHYSGNFWWAKSSYLLTLPSPYEFNNLSQYPNPLNSIRHNQEFWICYDKTKRHCSMWDCGINCYERHLHRYGRELYFYKKTVALCCIGQLRNGRFMMNNHKIFLIDYFSSLGYKIHIFLYTDIFDTSRTYVDVTTKTYNFVLTSIRNKSDIYQYLNTLKNNNVEYCDVIIKNNKIKEEGMKSNYFIEQYNKYFEAFKIISKTRNIYDIVVRYRFDNFFLDYPIIPKDNEFVECNYSKINYCTDTIQIFRGGNLKSLINQFNNLIFEKLQTSLNNFEIFPEHLIINLFNKAGMQLIKQDNFYFIFRGNFISYFKGINWKYYDDYINQEEPPYNINSIHCLRNKIKEKQKSGYNIVVNLNFNDNENLYFYDFVSQNEPIFFQELILSAFTPDKIICDSNHYMYSFIIREFENKL
jgi:hypothetical protein